MERMFAVRRSRGPLWDDAKPLEGQADWVAHAAFMDDLFARGIVALAGPLESTREALLIMRASVETEIVERLAPDPWTRSGLLLTTQISPWQLRLGSLGSAPVARPEASATPESLDPASLNDEQLGLWRQVEHLWELASRQDRGGIGEALHADYVGWDTSAPLPHDREAAIHSVTGPAPRLMRHSLHPLSVRVYDHLVGVAHYRYEATVQAADHREVGVAGKWTEVYIAHESRWLMIAVSGRPS